MCSIIISWYVLLNRFKQMKKTIRLSQFCRLVMFYIKQDTNLDIGTTLPINLSPNHPDKSELSLSKFTVPS